MTITEIAQRAGRLACRFYLNHIILNGLPTAKSRARFNVTPEFGGIYFGDNIITVPVHIIDFFDHRNSRAEVILNRHSLKPIDYNKR